MLSGKIAFFEAAFNNKQLALVKVNDTWFRWLIVIIPFLLGIFAESLSENPFDKSWLPRLVLSLITIVAVCEGGRFIIQRTRLYFRGRGNMSVRLLTVIAMGLAFTSLVIALNMLMTNYLVYGTWHHATYDHTSISFNNRKLPIGLIGIAFLKSIFLFIPLMLMHEGLYHSARLKDAERSKEQLEKEKLRAELQQLKGIINPHFLFNNLNSLSSLISENPPQAEAFLDEFTKVFRYLLRNNENELATLRQEIDFIGSYYHLLQTMYGSGISLEVSVHKDDEQMLLPPLTLQLLVENAVKHNRTQKENPLQIELKVVDGNRLLVRNNIIKKEGKVESTGIGLQSIKARYRMLNLPSPVVENDAEFFNVVVPLVSERDAYSH